MNYKNFILTIAISIILLGCSSKEPFINKKLNDTIVINNHKTFISDMDNNLSLFLAFSGGGTRAASLSYGVLKGLRNYGLLNNIAAISSVSGGSFTSAYYGLYKEKIFDDFEKKFLKKPIQTNILNTFLNPLNWFDFSLYNRSDFVSNYYEKEIFDQKTFDDLREDAPRIIINATDLSTGNAFSFTEYYFHKICSDLKSYPIGRAVAASSAIPVLFSSLPLKNYKNCKYNFINKIPKNKDLTHNQIQRYQIYKYLDKKNYPYLHLIDGGITDNLGVRAFLQITNEYNDDFIKLMKDFNLKETEKIAFIIVNGSDSLDPKIAKSLENPDISSTMDAISTIQLTRYNDDSLDLLKQTIKKWEEQIIEYRKENNIDNLDIKFYLIELNFKQLPKPKAKYFSRIRTSLELSTEDVDLLIQTGEHLLNTSKDFNKLLKDVNPVN